MSTVPDELQYSAEHEWVSGLVTTGTIVSVGITEHAAGALGDVVYVESPRVGDTVSAGEVCGELESSKAVSELYSPVSGTVVEVNESLAASPGVINDDPYGSGWIFKVEVTEQGTELLDADTYASMIS